jgi:hypothetical protein
MDDPGGGFEMLDMLFLMIAVAMSVGEGDFSTASTGTATAPAPVIAAEEPAANAPAFLAPKSDAGTKAPAFLAPSAKASNPAPAFLAPAAKPALVAESQAPTGRFMTATEVKPILNATRGNWIMVREYDGKDLLYVTQLWSWRCGLLEMRVGINGNDPEVWPMPECHPDQPSPAAILEDDGLPYREFGLGSIAMIEVELTYDDLSTDSVKFSRQGKIIP